MCQANLQPRVGRELQRVSGQFMKSGRLAGGEMVSEGSVDERYHKRRNGSTLQVITHRQHRTCFDRNYYMLQMRRENTTTEKQDLCGYRRGL